MNIMNAVSGISLVDESKKSKKNIRIGITGSTCSLGKALIQYLLTKNFHVKVLVRDINKSKEVIEESLLDGTALDNLHYYQGDITSKSDIKAFVEDLDLCYHIAAQVGHAKRSQYYETNVEGTRNVCEAIANVKNNRCKLVFCSSIATLRVTWLNRLLLTDYTMSKYEAEKVVTMYMHRIDVCIIYPGLIYGPSDNSFIPQFINAIKKGIPFLINGGEKNIPIIYIDDLVELFYRAGMSPKSKGQKYISVKNSEIGMHGFIEKIAEKANITYIPPKIKFSKNFMFIIAAIIEFIYKIFRLKTKPPLSKRIVDILSLSFDNRCTNAMEHLGWEQKFSIDQGLDMSMKYRIGIN